MIEKKEDLVILPEDPRAARQVTVTGWMDRDGRFWGDDERMARWSGSTHVHCTRCQQPVPKPYTACDRCQDLKNIEKYEKMPKKRWDGEGYIYSEAYGEYFDSLDAAREHLEGCNEESGGHLTLADMRLVICEPTTARYLEADYWCDDVPGESDGELPEWLTEAIDTFNKTLAANKDAPLSYSPGEYAVDLSDEEL